MQAPGPAAISNQVTSQRPLLPRIKTDFPPKIADDVVAFYRTGQFADPRPKKSLIAQSELLTDGHKRLLVALREECQALYTQNAHLKSRTQQAELRTVHLEVEATNCHQSTKAYRKAFGTLQAELEEADRSIGEIDSLMAQSRQKRLNRLSQIGQADGSSFARFEN